MEESELSNNALVLACFQYPEKYRWNNSKIQEAQILKKELINKLIQDGPEPQSNERKYSLMNK